MRGLSILLLSVVLLTVELGLVPAASARGEGATKAASFHEASFLLETLRSAAAATQSPVAAPELVLDGQGLTAANVVKVATQGLRVTAHPASLGRMRRAHELLLQAAEEGLPIYGLTHGVGLNKDKRIFSSKGEIDEEAREKSQEFNRNALHAHSAAVGEPIPEEQVRAIMLVRLNTMLAGRTGAQVEVAEMYVAFLNEGIHPVLPSRGSVGEGDITILPHIGLAMIGEWEVYYRGRRVPAAQALRAAGLEPIVPFAKDALSILSSNAVSAGLAALMVHDAEHLLSVAHLVYALSLEGLNGNVAPLLEPVHRLRPYPAQGEAAAIIRTHLEGSYLWELSEDRPLQDPLSFRTASHILGSATAGLEELRRQLRVQLNSSDDNPAVIVDLERSGEEAGQVAAYFVTAGDVPGAVIPTSNFAPFPWVLPLQSTGIALSHVSRASAQRTVRLSTSHFTGLRRFLGPDETAIAFGAIQKPFMALDAEIRELSNPVSMDSLPVAGDIEDTSTNALRAVRRVRRIVDNLYYVLGIELMHAAQAIDLRQRKKPDLSVGGNTRALWSAYRRTVPFLAKDRPLSPDIQKSYEFLKSYDSGVRSRKAR